MFIFKSTNTIENSFIFSLGHMHIHMIFSHALCQNLKRACCSVQQSYKGLDSTTERNTAFKKKCDSSEYGR